MRRSRPGKGLNPLVAQQFINGSAEDETAVIQDMRAVQQIGEVVQIVVTDQHAEIPGFQLSYDFVDLRNGHGV